MVSSKDVRLPLQLQRAMAAEAEAARESRAKVSRTILGSSEDPPHHNDDAVDDHDEVASEAKARLIVSMKMCQT